MANAAIFNALMRPVRSVDDYLTQYENRDAQKAAVQQNALAAMENAQIRKLQMEELLGKQTAALLKAQQDQQRQNMRGGYLNSIDPSAGPAMEFNPVSALRAGLDEKEIGLLSPQARKTITVGNTVLDAGTMKPLYQAPQKQPEPPAILQLVDARDKLPQGDPRRAVLDALITKQTTHAPAASAVSYGSPVPIMLPDGSIGYAQPGNKAGAAPQVLADPKTGKPLVKPTGADGAPTEGERKAATLLQRMRFSANQIAELTGSAGGGMDTPDKLATALSVLPVVGDVASRAANPQARRIIEDAQLDVLDAALTLGTGAAYTREQLEGYRKSYFPQVGDTPIDAKAKRERLANVLKAGETQAGRAAKTVPDFAPKPAASAAVPPGSVLKFDAQGNMVSQ